MKWRPYNRNVTISYAEINKRWGQFFGLIKERRLKNTMKIVVSHSQRFGNSHDYNNNH